jgi:hypothetical protein
MTTIDMLAYTSWLNGLANWNKEVVLSLPTSQIQIVSSNFSSSHSAKAPCSLELLFNQRTVFFLTTNQHKHQHRHTIHCWFMPDPSYYTSFRLTNFVLIRASKNTVYDMPFRAKRLYDIYFALQLNWLLIWYNWDLLLWFARPLLLFNSIDQLFILTSKSVAYDMLFQPINSYDIAFALQFIICHFASKVLSHISSMVQIFIMNP